MKRIFILMLFFLIGTILFNAQAIAARKEPKQKRQVLAVQGELVKKINVEGVKLRDRQKLEKTIKPYIKKRLTEDDIQRLIKQVEVLYLEAGYSGLVKISHRIKKHVLTIDASLLAR